MKKVTEFILLWFAASITIFTLVVLGLQWAVFNIILSSALVTALLMLIKKNRTKMTASSFYNVLMVELAAAHVFNPHEQSSEM